jgi:Mor family transcriptional regulator
MAVINCWNHYSDVPLNKSQMEEMQGVLGYYLPTGISTKNWQKDADTYFGRCDKEEMKKLSSEKFVNEQFNDYEW